VHDCVRFAQERGILCQGRGSAANSAVCFVLGVTAVDPASTSLLVMLSCVTPVTLVPMTPEIVAVPLPVPLFLPGSHGKN
jgi:hypothetical protein